MSKPMSFKSLCKASVEMGEMSEGTANYFLGLYASSEECRENAALKTKNESMEKKIAQLSHYVRAYSVDPSRISNSELAMGRIVVDRHAELERENAALREERDELRAWKEGKLGIEEYFSMVSQRDAALAEKVVLRVALRDCAIAASGQNWQQIAWIVEGALARKEAQP